MSIIENMYKKRETTTRVIERRRIFLTLVDGMVVSDDQIADWIHHMCWLVHQINYSFSFFEIQNLERDKKKKLEIQLLSRNNGLLDFES